MIKGAIEWSNPNHHYIQTNNPTEQFLKKLNNESKVSWLQSCGPTAAINCLAVLGHNLDIKCPGIYEPQPEEVLMDFFNDPRNNKTFDTIVKNYDDMHIPGNRFAVLYPYAVKQVFNVLFAEYKKIHDFTEIIKLLSVGNTVQLLLKNPSHFIAAIAYDDSEDKIIFNDPWPKRKGLKYAGLHEHMTKNEYDNNVTKYCVVYKGV